MTETQALGMMGSSTLPSFVVIGRIFGLIFGIFLIICMWKIFKKAGLPGRGSIIPFYNIYLWFKLAGRSGGWTRSILLPPLFLIITIITCFDISKKFGKSGGFGVGLIFLYPIFLGILAFGKAEYNCLN